MCAGTKNRSLSRATAEGIPGGTTGIASGSYSKRLVRTRRFFVPWHKESKPVPSNGRGDSWRYHEHSEWKLRQTSCENKAFFCALELEAGRTNNVDWNHVCDYSSNPAILFKTITEKTLLL
ncbi:hypothetical protein L0P88_06470 [Muricauda sp. SCSIO 64092]|uniref:hypothetical protein n=1 Tax=Allomuricauda sp. SCSIO 64092 TaxID=2908842 RepID=UPI001FF14FDE|nr:hypothetical protein [Muricauda sp. SCSIO 64092]UOY08193.1 hypothetical protein L0P88_06470 [Muricauda sp. SCSIO 64092]